jgi:choline dehydrogenase-like flavoprotein
MRRVSVYGVAAAAIKIQCGLAAVDHGGNAYRFERTRRDIRFADTDWYCALFQVAGRSWLTQNDHTIQLGVRDIGLLDDARSSTRLSENVAQWLSIYLPRQSLLSYFGFDWDFAIEPEQGLGRRRIYLPRGRTLGGSSSLNAMIYIRGNEADFGGWAREGAAGWSYREMLPYFIRSESNERGDPKYHGRSGPLTVQDGRSMRPLVTT